jgi:hypothetical protein
VKWPGHETDCSPPSSAIKNCGAIPPFPHMFSWHNAQLVKRRDSFTLLLFLWVCCILKLLKNIKCRGKIPSKLSHTVQSVLVLFVKVSIFYT